MGQKHHAAGLLLVVDNSSSADKSIPSFSAAESSRRCQSPGTLFRARHLRIASELAPKRAPNRSIFGQKSLVDPSMPGLSDKSSDVSRTKRPVTFFPVGRQLGMTEREYRKALAARMKAARLSLGYTQREMGLALKISEEAYRKHEVRGSLPPYLFQSFADFTGIDVIYLLTGHLEKVARVG